MIAKFSLKNFSLLIVALFVGSIPVKSETTELDSLISLADNHVEDTNKVNITLDIARIYIEFDFIKAIEHGKNSLKLSEELNYDDGIINSLSCIADAYDYTGRYAQAQKLNFRILSLQEKNNNQEGISGTYNNI